MSGLPVHAARVNSAEMVLAMAFYGEKPGEGLASAVCGRVIKIKERAMKAEDVTCPACLALLPAELEKDRKAERERLKREAESILEPGDSPMEWPE